MINIPETIIAGLSQPTNTCENNTLPVAAITPDGTTLTEKKQKKYISATYQYIDEYDNILLPGFALRYLFGEWYVIDPRGFRVKITKENLSYIIDSSDLTDKIIQNRCIWARKNSQVMLTLLVETSDYCNEAIANTELIKSKVSISEVKIGDTVLLENKLSGVYLGRVSLFGYMCDAMSAEMSIESYANRQIIELVAPSTNKFHYRSNLKILKILKKADVPMTSVQAVKHINDSINSTNSTYISSGTYFGQYTYGKPIKLVCAAKAPTVSIKLEEITFDEALFLFTDASKYKESGILALEKSDGKQYLINFPWFLPQVNLTQLDLTLLEIDKVTTTSIILTSDAVLLGSTMSGITALPTAKLDDFKKYYKIVKYVNDVSYV